MWILGSGPYTFRIRCTAPSLGRVESFLFNYNGDLVIGFGVVAILLVVFTRGRLGYRAEQNASLIYEDRQLAAQPTVPALRGK